MKSNKRSSGPRAQTAATAKAAVQSTNTGSSLWYYLAAAVLAIFLAFEIYGPAIRGPFLFDDRGLPFYLPGWADMPLSAWIMGVRPLLMFTYWINFQIGQTEPYWYHVFNV